MHEPNPINHTSLDLDELSARMREAMAVLGVDGKVFAAEVGVPYGTMRAYLSGERPPSSEFLVGAYRAFGLQPVWLLTGRGEMREGIGNRPDSRRGAVVVVPVLPVHASAGNGTVNDVGASYTVGGLALTQDWLAARRLNASNLAVITVKGSSMEGVLDHGNQVLVDQSDTQPRSGFIYVLRQADELLVKFCQLLPGGVLRVSSANANYAPYDVDLAKSTDVAIVGRVVASMRDW